jgi:hypothetical protein
MEMARSSCRSFRLRTNEFSRRWTATRMATLRWRSWKPSCTEQRQPPRRRLQDKIAQWGPVGLPTAGPGAHISGAEYCSASGTLPETPWRIPDRRQGLSYCMIRSQRGGTAERTQCATAINPSARRFPAGFRFIQTCGGTIIRVGGAYSQRCSRGGRRSGLWVPPVPERCSP